MADAEVRGGAALELADARAVREGAALEHGTELGGEARQVLQGGSDERDPLTHGIAPEHRRQRHSTSTFER